MMFSSDKVDIYALKKDNYISISLETPVIEAKTSNTISAIEPESSDMTQEVDIGNLFSDVWTKKIKKTTKKVKTIDSKRFQEIQKRIKTTQKNKVDSISQKINKTQAIKKDSIDSKASTSNEVNEYLAKIQALVYTHFYPPQNSQGHSVKAVIELSSIGKVLDFRILTYSANSSLNSECDKIKDRLMSALFPISPQSQSGNYIIILTSKE